MMVKTHVNSVIPFGIAVSYYLDLGGSETGVFLAFATLGVVMPDIDEPNSYIGRKAPVFSILLSMLIRHRGVTHFLIFPLLIFFAGLLFDGVARLALFGVAVGWLVHILGDMLTDGGVRGFLSPIYGGRIALLPSVFRFQTGSFTEFIILCCLFVANMFLISNIFLSQQTVRAIANAVQI